MDTKIYLLCFLPLLVALLLQAKRKKTVKQLIRNKKRNGALQMKELAKKFIGKECIINTIDDEYIGVITEISNNGIMIKKGDMPEAVNLDFVSRIREFPRNKKGKKKSVVID